MATVNILLYEAYKSKDGTYPIVIRVEYEGRQRRIPVGYKIEKKYWASGQVSSKHPDAALINAAISSRQAEIRRYLADCSIHGKPVHMDLIGTGKASHSFTDYLRHRGEQYKASGRIVMNRKISRFIDELLACAGREVYFHDVTPDFLRDLENWQIDQGNIGTTRHKKFKMLGEFFGQAMKEGKADGANPFKAHKIAAKPAKKEKLTEGQLAAIEDLALRPGAVNNARNLFLFSYYCKGMRFERCIMLRRTDIKNGRIYFKMNKGEKYISVKIHERLQAILDHYPGTGEFVFPFVTEHPKDPEKYLSMIASANTIVNRNLKVIGAMDGVKTAITFHMARHSFAFHLKKRTDSIHVIKDSLGHSETRTTEIYLQALDDEVLDGEMEKLYGR